MASKFVYTIRNKATGSFFQGYTSFGPRAKEFKSEASARNSLDYFVSNTVNRKLWNKPDETWTASAEDLKTLFPYDLEIVKQEIVYSEVSVSSVDNTVKNVIIRKKLQEKSWNWGYFWDNALRKGFADQLQYVVQLESSKGTTRHDTVKEARAQLRLLGVKTRTFREYNGMFGFYNRDQAFKARLTLNTKDVIDLTELKKELFG